MSAKREITRDDIIPIEQYAAERKERRTAISALKRHRRVAVGPWATFYFESYDTMWHQIHEMLYIEKGGEAQIEDELRAYAPLIPKGNELVATVMFEIDEKVTRQRVLGTLGGVEKTMFIEVAGDRVASTPEEDVDRTTAAGKASSVQFVHFHFTEAQAEAFRAPGARVVVGIEHPSYGHMSLLPEETRAALAADLG
ncbi:MAG: DUF3501 family protein [Proteobacteria bacterium]|nr:DUF3501 family protein [Pseudomonadota bacterium]